MTDAANTPATVPAPRTTVDGWWGTPEADEVEGYDLLKNEALSDLVGVPFLIHKVVYRDGIQRKGTAWRDDYVSVELRVAPADVCLRDLSRIQSRRKSAGTPILTAEQAAALPGEQLVINDGSTGVYRQITQYLAAKELITLPEGEETGGKGESIYDLPRSEWLAGADAASEGIDVILRCSRGLRFSDYTNAYTGDDKARTWYIA